MKRKNPYIYPHKSRAAMVEYLTAHESRHGGHNYPTHKWFPLVWNVKVYDDLTARTPAADHDCPRNPAYDSAWAEHVQSNAAEGLFYHAAEDASRYLTEGEYTTYPGDDQGQWAFAFGGRSGGWLILESWAGATYGADFLRQFDGPEDWREWLGGLNFAELRALYRAVRCMDSDFSPDKVRDEIRYHVAHYRAAWEEEHGYMVKQQAEALKEKARDIEASRPDMYGPHKAEG